MTLVEKIRELSNEKGMSLPQLETTLGLGNGTISRWRNASPNTDKLQKVADYFSVSMDYLLGRDTQELTPKDERDISKTVSDLMDRLTSSDGAPLYFDGAEMTPETKILFEQQLKSLVTTVKEINKMKYNPNKNKK